MSDFIATLAAYSAAVSAIHQKMAEGDETGLDLDAIIALAKAAKAAEVDLRKQVKGRGVEKRLRAELVDLARKGLVDASGSHTPGALAENLRYGCAPYLWARTHVLASWVLAQGEK